MRSVQSDPRPLMIRDADRHASQGPASHSVVEGHACSSLDRWPHRQQPSRSRLPEGVCTAHMGVPRGVTLGTSSWGGDEDPDKD